LILIQEGAEFSVYLLYALGNAITALPSSPLQSIVDCRACTELVRTLVDLSIHDSPWMRFVVCLLWNRYPTLCLAITLHHHDTIVFAGQPAEVGLLSTSIRPLTILEAGTDSSRHQRLAGQQDSATDKDISGLKWGRGRRRRTCTKLEVACPTRLSYSDVQSSDDILACSNLESSILLVSGVNTHLFANSANDVTEGITCRTIREVVKEALAEVTSHANARIQWNRTEERNGHVLG
jgi:hypothetical protein